MTWFSMPGEKLSPNGSAGKYNQFTFDQTQRAYIIPRKGTRPQPIRFDLAAIYDDEQLHGTMWLVNPTFIVPNWSTEGPIELKLNNRELKPGTDFRHGIEKTESGTNLVVWLNKTIDLTKAENHRATFSISP